MQGLLVLLLAAAPLEILAISRENVASTPAALHKGHRHHRHGHHHNKHLVAAVNSTLKTVAVVNSTLNTATSAKKDASASTASADARPMNLLHSMKKLEADLSVKERQETASRRGELEINGPLPADFADRFAKEVAKVTGCKAEDIKVLNTTTVDGHDGVDEIVFEAPPDIIKAVEEQAADPDSKLAKGPLRIFLIEKAGEEDAEAESKEGKTTAEIAEKEGSELEKEGSELEKEGSELEKEAPVGLKPEKDSKDRAESKDSEESKDGEESEDGDDTTPVQSKGIDVDVSMPYGELEPFGREDTAQELTRGSIRESDEMVDQLERAEVAEEKRAVFRALTRLRGAAITSFDGVARSQTGNIDGYARSNHWRSTHPVRHLAEEEGDVGKWSFPDNADF